MRDNRRRNRNIGTSRSGHGVNNRLTIPERWSDLSIYWEKLSNYISVKKNINDHIVNFIVEKPRDRYLHHCTVQDVHKVLELLPYSHIEAIDLVVFRQPTVKQERLAPVWGRLAYWSEIGKFKGTGIFLEAQPIHLTLKWGKSLRPEDQSALVRLQKAGFIVESHSRGYHIHSTPEAIRTSQLYHTVPHEIGHHVDYTRCLQYYEYNNDYERFWELYSAKPEKEKEVFAHLYADRFKDEMREKGLIPFEPTYDQSLIKNDNLVPEWFMKPEPVEVPNLNAETGNTP